MLDFTYNGLPSRVVFGADSFEKLPDEIERMGVHNILILCKQQNDLAQKAADLLGSRAKGIYDKVVMHVPFETAENAKNTCKSMNIDCLLAIGGGSTIGLAKAIALEIELPIIAIPTTYAGSEMTPIWGITQDGIKTTGRDPRVLPKTVIYDPKLTFTLPDYISAPSGMNAIAHCVEALYSEETNPVISMMAEEGIKALGESLPIVVKEPENLVARSKAFYGTWLAGSVLGSVGMAIHHKICHTLGGTFNLPHAEVHTVIIPHATAYNKEAAPDAMRRISRALFGDDAPQAIYDLAVKIGAKVALKDIGMKEEDLDKAAEIATKNPYYNPRPVTKQDVQKLLKNAYNGVKP